MFAGYSSWVSTVNERKAAPAIGSAQTKEQIVTRAWSVGPAAKREQMVIDALHRVNNDLPGPEASLEEEESVCEAFEEDKSTGSSPWIGRCGTSCVATGADLHRDRVQCTA